MIRIAICDDQSLFIDQLEALLAIYSKNQEMTLDIDCFTAGTALLASEKKYDLLFLDTNGNITSVPPIVGYQTTIGKALSSNSILLNIKDPIEL